MNNKSLKNLVSILFIGLPLYLNAQQNRFIGGVLLNFNGIEFNGNTSQFWNTSSSTTRIDGVLGYSIGLSVKRELTQKFYSILEFRYSQNGSIYEYNSQYATEAFETIILNYIELPILVGYKIKPKKTVFYIEGGFAFAKMISSNIATFDLERIGTPNADKFKSIDISWICCLKFPLIRKWQDKFLFGLRVSNSILSIHKYYKLYNFDYGIEFEYIFN